MRNRNSSTTAKPNDRRGVSPDQAVPPTGRGSALGTTPNPRARSTTPFAAMSQHTGTWVQDLKETGGKRYTGTPLFYPKHDPTNRKRLLFSKIFTALVYYCIAVPLMLLKKIVSRYTEKRYRKRQIARFENALQYTEDSVTWLKAAVELDRLRGFEEWRLITTGTTLDASEVDAEQKKIEELIRAASESDPFNCDSPVKRSSSGNVLWVLDEDFDTTERGEGEEEGDEGCVVAQATRQLNENNDRRNGGGSKRKKSEKTDTAKKAAVKKPSIPAGSTQLNKTAAKKKYRVDIKGIVDETKAIKQLQASGNQTAIGEYIRTHLLRDALGMDSPELYMYYTGTKAYVEDYLEAMREMIQQFSMDGMVVTSSAGNTSTINNRVGSSSSSAGGAGGSNSRNHTPPELIAVAGSHVASSPAIIGSLGLSSWDQVSDPTNSNGMTTTHLPATTTGARDDQAQLLPATESSPIGQERNKSSGAGAQPPAAGDKRNQVLRFISPQPRGAEVDDLIEDNSSCDNELANNFSTNDSTGGSALHKSRYTRSVLGYAETNCCPGSLGFALPLQKRLELLEAAAQSFGRSCLMLSGGASLGMYHIGVVRALFEANLLPKIMSGSSAGSIIGAVVCTSSEEELAQTVLDGFADIYFKAFEEIDQAELNVMTKLKRVTTSGGFMDTEQLAKCLRTNCGDLTFLEAFEKTGRIFNVSVAADRQGEKATLLNYLTTPNVLVWSGVVASCCAPGLFKKVELLQKDPSTGVKKPYMPGQKWFDGSVANDLPKQQLAEMFNCNYFIVSQVNPHVVPFVKNDSPSVHKKPTGWMKRAWFGACREAGHWCAKLAKFGSEAPILSEFKIVEFYHSLFKQEYLGDVSIFPIGSVWDAIPDFINITTNPTPEHMMYVGSKGLRRSLPYLHQIRCMTEIERVLEAEISRLKSQLVLNKKTEALRKANI